MRGVNRTRSLVLIGLAIALLAVGAFITIPLGPIPFTLQTLMLVVTILVLSPAEALAAVGGYLVLGAIGLPIFSGMRGGLGVLAGPTGGFLIGFFLGALIAGLIRSMVKQSTQRIGVIMAVDIVAAVAVVLMYYIAGVFFFDVVTSSGLETALLTCVIPFVIPDVIKVVIALICAKPIRAVIGRDVT